jgi:glycosyltransferase involved in cell wall biosynthesis
MKTLKVPIVATLHHPIPIDRETALTQARSFREKYHVRAFYSFWRMQSLVIRRMDRVITVSKSSAQEAERVFKLPQSKLRVVHNGIDTNVFKRQDDISKGSTNLIMVGNTEDRRKGVLYLLQALHLLKGETKVNLTIVDKEGPEAKYAPALVKEYGLESMITLTGRISLNELVKRYSAAEVAVVPALYEGFGLPAAEAMACELPVITTRGGALPEVVGEDGEAGILVPPGDPHALAAAIKRLLADPELRRKMGEVGRKRVETHFTWEEAAKKTVEVYQEVL